MKDILLSSIFPRVFLSSPLQDVEVLARLGLVVEETHLAEELLGGVEAQRRLGGGHLLEALPLGRESQPHLGTEAKRSDSEGSEIMEKNKLMEGSSKSNDVTNSRSNLTGELMNSPA